MCLFLGPTGVGKTLLLKRLHSCSSRGSYTDIGNAPATLPTVGTNLVNITVGRKLEATIREVGGSMAPIWPNYYKDCTALMFMIDSSNREQVAAACILLLDILAAQTIVHTPVLVILNKCDIPQAMNRIEIESVFRLEDVMREAKRDMKVVECSAKTGTGLAPIADWIHQHVKPMPVTS